MVHAGTPRLEDDPLEPPDVSHLVTEDDVPVESFFQDKQMRLLVEPLYASWRPLDRDGAPRPFLAAADVGVFGSVHERAIAPDVLLAADVATPDDFGRKEKRSYFLWEFGKPPDIVIEIVSNREGGELDEKRARYARLRVPYYVVFDPLALLGDAPVRAFEARGQLLVPVARAAFPELGLGLVEWTGTYETKSARWLRWCRLDDGRLLPTGAERAEAERERADTERERADAERERAEAERERAEAERERADAERKRADELQARLRALGIEP